MSKKPYISGHFFMTEFDFYLDDVTNNRSMEFSEEAKKNGRAEIKYFNSVHEYNSWREFQGFGSEPLEELAVRV